MHVARLSVFLLLSATALAADAVKPMAPPPPIEDSIATAKRDLDEIKAMRSGVEHPKADLPRFSTPEISLGSPGLARPNVKLSPGEAAAAKKSANWLVDAMAKKSERTGDTKTTGEKSRPDEVPEDADKPALGEAKQSNEKSSRPDLRKSSEPAVNPLTNFMAGWMTPQDYKLLQSTTGGERTSGVSARGEPIFGLTQASTGEATGAVSRNQGQAGPTASQPHENPFVPGTAVATRSVAPTAAQPPPTAAAPSAPRAIMPVPETPAQKSPTPAFVKPQDDAKYFKPLKRF